MRFKSSILSVALLLGAFVLTSPVTAQQKPTKAQIKKGDLADKSTAIVLTPALTDYCRLLYGCGLEVPPATCPSPKELGKASFSYDNERCSEAREFTRRGITPSHPTWGFRL